MSTSPPNHSPLVLRNVSRKRISCVSKRWVQILKKRKRDEVLSRWKKPINSIEGNYDLNMNKTST